MTRNKKLLLAGTVASVLGAIAMSGVVQADPSRGYGPGDGYYGYGHTGGYGHLGGYGHMGGYGRGYGPHMYGYGDWDDRRGWRDQPPQRRPGAPRDGRAWDPMQGWGWNMMPGWGPTPGR